MAELAAAPARAEKAHERAERARQGADGVLAQIELFSESHDAARRAALY